MNPPKLDSETTINIPARPMYSDNLKVKNRNEINTNNENTSSNLNSKSQQQQERIDERNEFNSKDEEKRKIAKREEEELQKAINESLRELGSNSGFDTRILSDLFTRDLTPEDYEILLMLDERVEKKTVSNVEKFRKSIISKEVENSCTICLSSFEIGSDTCFEIPCNHVFHSECLEQWLKSSFVCPNCKLDLS